MKKSRKIRDAILKMREKRGLINSEHLPRTHKGLVGDASRITGDASHIWGLIPPTLSGNVSELNGDVTNMEGPVPNLESFELEELLDRQKRKKEDRPGLVA